MTGNEYQELASRTINQTLSDKEKRMHALFGIVSEVGEIMDIYQKTYQGHEYDETHVLKEVGDLFWFISEYCTSRGVWIEDVMKMNIDKLKARYPKGFREEDSLNRDENDI